MKDRYVQQLLNGCKSSCSHFCGKTIFLKEGDIFELATELAKFGDLFLCGTDAMTRFDKAICLGSVESDDDSVCQYLYFVLDVMRYVNDRLKDECLVTCGCSRAHNVILSDSETLSLQNFEFKENVCDNINGCRASVVAAKPEGVNNVVRMSTGYCNLRDRTRICRRNANKAQNLKVIVGPNTICAALKDEQDHSKPIPERIGASDIRDICGHPSETHNIQCEEPNIISERFNPSNAFESTRISQTNRNHAVKSPENLNSPTNRKHNIKPQTAELNKNMMCTGNTATSTYITKDNSQAHAPVANNASNQFLSHDKMPQISTHVNETDNSRTALESKKFQGESAELKNGSKNSMAHPENATPLTGRVYKENPTDRNFILDESEVLKGGAPVMKSNCDLHTHVRSYHDNTDCQVDMNPNYLSDCSLSDRNTQHSMCKGEQSLCNTQNHHLENLFQMTHTSDRMTRSLEIVELKHDRVPCSDRLGSHNMLKETAKVSAVSILSIQKADKNSPQASNFEMNSSSCELKGDYCLNRNDRFKHGTIDSKKRRIGDDSGACRCPNEISIHREHTVDGILNSQQVYPHSHFARAEEPLNEMKTDDRTTNHAQDTIERRWNVSNSSIELRDLAESPIEPRKTSTARNNEDQQISNSGFTNGTHGLMKQIDCKDTVNRTDALISNYPQSLTMERLNSTGSGARNSSQENPRALLEHAKTTDTFSQHVFGLCSASRCLAKPPAFNSCTCRSYSKTTDALFDHESGLCSASRCLAKPPAFNSCTCRSCSIILPKSCCQHENSRDCNCVEVIPGLSHKWCSFLRRSHSSLALAILNSAFRLFCAIYSKYKIPELALITLRLMPLANLSNFRVLEDVAPGRQKEFAENILGSKIQLHSKASVHQTAGDESNSSFLKDKSIVFTGRSARQIQGRPTRTNLEGFLMNLSSLITDVYTAYALSFPTHTPSGHECLLSNTFTPRDLKEFAPAYAQALDNWLTIPNSFSPTSDTGESALSGLLLLHSLSSKCDALPPSAFYLPKITGRLKLKVEYRRFKNGSKSLLAYSCAIPINMKAELIRYEHGARMKASLQDAFFTALYDGPKCPFLTVDVSRSRVLMDVSAALRQTTALSKQLRVTLKDEDGVDSGGLRTEVFQLLSASLSTDKSFVRHGPYLWLNGASKKFARFADIGRVLGVALFNDVCVCLPLPLCLFKKLLGKSCTLNDLKDLDPALYSSLRELLNFTRAEIDSLDIPAIAVHKISKNNTLTIKVDEKLTKDNLDRFIEAYIELITNKSIQKHFKYLKNAFFEVVNFETIESLTPRELQEIICGNTYIDIELLKKTTIYKEYRQNDDVIKYFWEIFAEYDDDLQKKLLQFITGCERIPIICEKNYLTIMKNGCDTDRLPSSQTCFNTLLLPEYKSKERMKEKLDKAITMTQGFYLM